jgi:hypothetical protein
VKTANIIAQQSAWLATQQMPDGSWQRPRGYTSNHYDTAWAGLGLMATGDTAFAPHIRKAAHFLAFEAKPDGWAVPSSVVVIFLSEYWLRYHARWNISFVLPGGQFVAAATQGKDIMVRDPRGDWVSPRDHALLAGSVGEFCYTSGWQRYECRVPEFRMKSEPPLVEIAALRPTGGTAWEDAASIIAGKPGSVPLDGVDSLEVPLVRPTALRAIDFRADKVGGVVVEAKVGETWKVIHLGRPASLLKELAPVTTKHVRITLRKVKKGASLKLLRLCP